jgi:hypothetical protein
MGKNCDLRAGWMWLCFTIAALLLAALIATRWVAVDFQTGTPLAITLDQGAVIAVVGDESMPLSVEARPHDPDQVAWQWWFAGFPQSFVAPLWVPLLVFSALAMSLRRHSSVPSIREHATANLVAAPAH